MHDENTLYLECRSGISGDMTVAALLDLGATEEHLREELRKLPVDGYEIQVKKVVKSGLQVSDFDVILEHEAPAHTHDHMHTHVHRSWADIEKMLLESDLKPRVKALSLQMFRTVAEAEAHVHGRSIAEVHFHEVGAVDSIVDIVGTAACLDELNVDKVLVSELTEGCGHVHCQHGELPVPVPAVLEIAAAHHLTLHQMDQEGEMVTPTGAAIAALSEGQCPGAYCVKKIGMGAGKREYKTTNILRAMLIEEK
ncbi:LarC family nickel insertion protein [Clostridiaceae bacterium AM27-36LB]|mgnify:CR=1 FL=1|nr:LarC family nickel insertion protein [Clostridiales bacterium AM23-16LB]RHR44711.1 LarC family nickel insertion protein [Clostridiaceae bacterium AF18-31LB]RHT82325.1 LarC family nickel insertion protein [Clostridiaceae bacterium AM27-36LB]RHW04692.1 LarC family nickel insertion protein [Clostridiaceae bacterium OF09-1]